MTISHSYIKFSGKIDKLNLNEFFNQFNSKDIVTTPDTADIKLFDDIPEDIKILDISYDLNQHLDSEDKAIERLNNAHPNLTFTKIEKSEFDTLLIQSNKYKNTIDEKQKIRDNKLQSMSVEYNGHIFDVDETASDRLDRVITLQTAQFIKELSKGTSASEAYKKAFTDFKFYWNDKAGNTVVISAEDCLHIQEKSLICLFSAFMGVEVEQVETILNSLKG